MSKKSIGQKILHFPLTKIIIGISVVISVFSFSKSFLSGVFHINLLTINVIDLIITITSSMLSVVAYINLYKFYESREIRKFSSHGIGKNIVLGILLGDIAQSLTI